MQNNLTFSDFLKEVFNHFDKKMVNSGLISLCIEIPPLDLLNIYDYFFSNYSFSAFWEENDQVSFIAFDKCKYITLEGNNKFELAKKFNYETFENIVELTRKTHFPSTSKLIYFFSFSDNYRKNNTVREVPNMEAILPKILIVRDGEKAWLRINAQVLNKSSLRTVVEEMWFIRNQIIKNKIKNNNIYSNKTSINKIDNYLSHSKNSLMQNINKSIQLVKDGILDKIVISSRITFKLNEDINLIKILKKLRINQPNTCRYVWKRNNQDITFGASPEKLFSFNQKNLCLEAIAGTSENDANLGKLLNSRKDIREHNFVIAYLIECLQLLKINNFKQNLLEVISFGNISHLRTLISCEIEEICPFELLKVLHPSPAVCGSPKKESLHWIETLESFSRDNYASPIGWVDENGNADFRVAIRGARFINNKLELTAGSGIVNGSICEEEIKEIKLKFDFIFKEIFTKKIIL